LESLKMELPKNVFFIFFKLGKLASSLKTARGRSLLLKKYRFSQFFGNILANFFLKTK
jgi:hypothetical protein